MATQSRFTSCEAAGQQKLLVVLVFLGKPFFQSLCFIFLERSFSNFYFLSMLLPRGIVSNWKPLTNHSKDPRFNKVPIVTFEPANSEAMGNNHTAYDLVFKFTRIIEIVDLCHQDFTWLTMWCIKVILLSFCKNSY